MAQKRKSNKANAKRQLYSIIGFAVAIFLMFVVFIKGQNIWTVMHNILFSLFGITAYVLPIMIGLTSVLSALNKNSGIVKARIIESSFLIYFFGALLDSIFNYSDGLVFNAHWDKLWNAGGTLKEAVKGGGVFGALVSHPICKGFGKTGAVITISIIIFVLLMILTGTTLINLFKTFSKPIKAVSNQAEKSFGDQSEKTSEKSGNLRIIKGFDVDVPVDDIPEKRTKKKKSLNEIQQKVVDTYNEEDNLEEAEKIPVTKSSADVEQALETAREEEQKPEKITVDFESETAKVAEEINDDVIKNYRYPPTELLKASNSVSVKALNSELEATANRLVEALRSFNVETRVVDISRGPTVTRYELQPCAGVKISKITNLADDIALNLASAGVRIEAPIPNKAAVGIEVPNKVSAVVGVREIIESTAFLASKSKLTVAMGRDIGGNIVVTDIAKMPHGLIAGATGSGKSVCINSIIISILYKASPDDVKLLMIDPKVVELGVYNGIPHLLVPVVTDPRKAAGALGWAVSEMEKRYQMFADRGVRDIEGYNRLVDTLIDEPEVKKMPHIVIVIDELADLMMTAPHEVEDSINRIAAKARAAGMHLLIATQRPSVDVVTGVIKANIPTRIAFAVSSYIDSKTILDTAGAEKLLGRGDMLFSPVGSSKPKRIQGCFVSDAEVEKVVEFVKKSGSTDYSDDIMVEIERQAAVEKHKSTGLPEDAPDADPMLEEAIKVVVENGQASTSLLQRKLKLGYARAARIVDEMEERGVVGPYEGSKPRKVLITKKQLMEKEAGDAQ